MSFNSAIKKLFSLRRIDTDNFPRGAIYQCVDPTKWVLNKSFKLPYDSYGNAIQYWTNTHPRIAKKFKRVSNRVAKRGDIIVIKGSLGHILWATGKNRSTSVEGVEQNGGRGLGQGTGTDAIRKRYIPKSSIAGILRPKLSTLILAKLKPVPKKKPKVTPSVSYTVLRAIPGYYTSLDAKAKKNAVRYKVKAGRYSVFNKANGMINVTQESGTPGTWINPDDNKKSKPKPKKKEYLKVRKGEGISHLAKRAKYKDWKKQSRWKAIAKLNGSGNWKTFNANLKPNKKVRVR